VPMQFFQISLALFTQTVRVMYFTLYKQNRTVQEKLYINQRWGHKSVNF
jgi:hypothetical protein